ncbi:MAG: hypothetical protein AMXMBFR33_70560 [Candidatus Xenobia bacterium]
MRIAKLAFLSLTLLLLGCSGGMRSDGTPAPPPGPGGTSNLSLRVDVGQVAAQNRGTPTRLTIRIVDANETERDVVAAVVIDITGTSLVQRTISNVPIGMRRVRLAVFDEEGTLLGSLLSDPINVQPGTNPPLSLQVTFSPTPSPTPTPNPTATQLSFRTQPTGTLVGQTIAPPVEVAVLDSNSNLVTTATDTITLSLSSNPGGATLSGTLSASAVNGVATFSDLSLNQVGTGYALQASATGLTSGTSNAFDIASSVGPPARLLFGTQPVDTVAGQVITPAVQVVVQDSNGITVPTASNAVTMAFGANPGSSVLNGTVTVNAVNGVATFGDLSVSLLGVGYTLVASSPGLAGATSNAFNALNPATQLAFGTQPVTSQARAAMPLFTVEIRDVNGNLVTTATDTVTIALASNPGPATLSGTLSVAAVNGVATFNNVILSKSGNGYTLTATTTTGLTPATSSAFNETFPRGFLTPLAGFPLAIPNQPVRGAITNAGTFLYVAEFNTFTPTETVVGFSVAAGTGALAGLGGSPYQPGGNQPVAVRVTPDDTKAVVTNAGSNTWTVFTINGLGDLTLPTAPAGTGGANPLDMVLRQGVTNSVYIFNFSSNSVGQFDLGTQLAIGPTLPTAPGSATQEGVLHPNNNLLFANTGDVFSIAPATGILTAVPFSPFATAEGSTVAIDPAGTFLYTPVTGGVAVHAINAATGFLTPIAGSPFSLPGPAGVVSMALNGEFLYVTPDLDTMTHIFAIDPVTGALTEIDDSPVNTGENRDTIVDPFSQFLYFVDKNNDQLGGFAIVP